VLVLFGAMFGIGGLLLLRWDVAGAMLVTFGIGAVALWRLRPTHSPVTEHEAL
jgi:hypothetical protein